MNSLVLDTFKSSSQTTKTIVHRTIETVVKDRVIYVDDNQSHFKLKMLDNDIEIPKTFNLSTKEMIFKQGETALNGKYPLVGDEFTAEIDLGNPDKVLYATVNILTRNNVFSDLNATNYSTVPYNATASVFCPNEITNHNASFNGTKVASYVAYVDSDPKRLMALGLEIVPGAISVSNNERILYWGNPNAAVPTGMTNAKTISTALNIGPHVINSKKVLVGNYYNSAGNNVSLALHDHDFPSDTYIKDSRIVKTVSTCKLVIDFVMGADTTKGGDISPNVVFKIDVNH